MEAPESGDITRLLKVASQGDAMASEQLLSIIYHELHRLAEQTLANERSDNSMQTTALVHEAWMRLCADHASEWENRAHFFGAAAEAMRRILVDRARRAKRIKRGGDQRRVGLDEISLAEVEERCEEILAVDEALTRLQQSAPRPSRVVVLRFFLGLDAAQSAKIIGVSPATIQRDWVFARAWLQRELTEEGFENG
jgi:RNA polymerase sigma factor (TIGR02999 family)